jgi:hypothetical protein
MCAMVRDDARVAAKRPHTREFDQDRRDKLGLAIQRAREAAGHPFRPSFAELAGPGLSLRSLVKLEQGEPVGASVYEAAARALAKYFEDWSEDTPRAILEDDLTPANVRRECGSATSDETEPDPADYPDLEDFLTVVIKQLLKRGASREAIKRAVDRVVEEIQQGKLGTERNDPDTPRGEVS